MYIVPVRLIDNSGSASRRLAFTGGSEDKSRGRVEIYVDGEWHAVCSYKFGFKEANVICNQLGYNGARRVRTGHYGQGNGNIVAYSDSGCGGGEDNVLNCDYHTVSEADNCTHEDDVGVECLGMFVSGYVITIIIKFYFSFKLYIWNEHLT